MKYVYINSSSAVFYLLRCLSVWLAFLSSLCTHLVFSSTPTHPYTFNCLVFSDVQYPLSATFLSSSSFPTLSPTPYLIPIPSLSPLLPLPTPTTYPLCSPPSINFTSSQYSQAPNKGKFRLATFGLRLALNKILPFFFSPPAFLLVMNEKDMPYKEVRRRCPQIQCIFF